MKVSSFCMIVLTASRAFLNPEEEIPRRRVMDIELQEREWSRPDLQARTSLIDGAAGSAYDPARLLPPAPTLSPKIAALSVSTLDEADKAFLKFMAERRHDWLANKSTDHKLMATYLDGLSLDRKLKLMLSAFNDFNRGHRVEGRTTAASAELSASYRMAAMINEASKSTFRVPGLDAPTKQQRMKDHLVLSYFMANLMDNKGVAFFRKTIVNENPNLKSKFTARQLELMESDDALVDSYHRELDDVVMNHFLQSA